MWDRVIAVNLKGTYLVSWHAVPEMVKAGGGSIINLASIMGLVGYHKGRSLGFDPYPASKGGVINFTRNLAMGVAKDGVRVNCICPGYTWTNLTERLTTDPEMLRTLEDLTPMGRLGRPEEIANAASILPPTSRRTSPGPPSS